ncbi:DUF3298 and DUF4163 domain-containing protein [Psychrobacillus sp. FJAT-21963]|uniref:DUF3298 and DUF4163 domain-containing protein n=1 Tax=Psychrobacillus sp. FJAT-21963 TaxID=1712028 RepID=UPI0006FC8060|nr:DUF3298 and DUF4163 domain-containing protein [Psychrobacillus sp. FJAT-21963]KQL32442.1 hypothetical protein AN959_19480 [Psychrobacillus sp. FJAT-21963]
MDLPILIKTKYVQSPKVNVSYPIVTKLPHPQIEKKINNEIISTLNKMLIEEGFYNENLVEMIGHYEVKTNERGILSLSLLVYSYTGGAHGLTIIQSLTFDVATGKLVELKDLFEPNSQYVKILSEIIEKKIVEWEVPVLEEFKEIRMDQDFYLADHSIVIYFQVYEITPYVYGFPYFPIAIKDIEEIILAGGPLDKLLQF